MTEKTHNQPEYSVSEVSGALKRVVEDNFGYVRVRGELSGFKRATSGHLYMDLKDDKAVLNGVCWKGKAASLSFKPEDGLEVIATGKITTYAGRSNYQIVIDSMEPAGAGALMALLEKRKKELAAEGLFAPERKQRLPFMPQHIGVITSPTGAVIRDILHRLNDRFPVRVSVWPVRVQGEGAAEEIAAAIAGFNAFHASSCGRDSAAQDLAATDSAQPLRGSQNDDITRPDLLIVARGGGSIEDLWCFNEENVVRAVAASAIPIISAVGHETDTTLIDYVSDQRAPTPTAAAEMAVPVRREWMLALDDWQNRMNAAMHQRLSRQSERVESLTRAIPSPQQMLAHQMQRLDDWTERLGRALPARTAQAQQQLTALSERLSPRILLQHMTQQQELLRYASERITRATQARIERAEARLKLPAILLESLNYKQVLKRGFAIVKSGDTLITNAPSAQQNASLKLVFHDGEVDVKTGAAKTKARTPTPKQESLFD
jgi:exodeoxyribonuclease VII large subunit